MSDGADALALLHGLVLDGGGRRRWGEVATSWQRDDAAAVLDPAFGGPRLNWLGRPKGGSKSTDLAGMSAAWLVEQAPHMAEGFAVAADEEQANRLLDKARGFISRTPAIGSVLRVEARRIVNVQTGARVVALAADVAGSEGLLSPFIVVDELPNWKSTASARGMWTSVISSLPKWPGMRLVVIGHAGDPAHWSFKVLEHARSSAAWRVNEVPGPLPWVGEEALAEQRAMLAESQFRRRHLNEWTGSEDRLTSLDDLLCCVKLDGPLRPSRGVDYVIGVDLGLKSDRTVVSVVHAEAVDEISVRVPAGEGWPGPAPVELGVGGASGSPERGVRVVLDRMGVWQGSRQRTVLLSEVEEWIVQASESFNRARVVLDPWQAIGMAQRLRTRGVRVKEFTFGQASVGRLASTLHLLLRNRALVLPGDQELLDELANVRLRETSPGVMRMDHDADRHDDRAISLALGAYELLEAAPSHHATMASWQRFVGRRAR